MTPSPSRMSFRFHGQAAEYFRIWIVNICLTVVTIGIYSAWAKVRRKRYFYSNTQLNVSSFDYLASPGSILKGRIIVFVAFVIYSIAKDFAPIAALVILAVLLFVLPVIVVRALRFNAVNSSYRNVRFGFKAEYWETFRLVLIPIFLIALTLGLIYPYYEFRKRKYFIEHSAYGGTPFTFSATAGAYYSVYMRVSLRFLLVLVGSIVTLGLGLIPLFAWLSAYRHAEIARLAWSNTGLGDIRFDCDWKTGPLFKLYIVNALAVLFTLGLLLPWAAIRLARYQIGNVSIAGGDLDSFVAVNAQAVDATGEEADLFLGFDFGL
jgi:uncharacterized membrane protein YjgN (DUF898 family)